MKWKAVPPLSRRLEPDAAAMRFDDRPADRQADAHAVRLGRDERLEQLRRDRRRDAGAGILDDDLDQPLGAARVRDASGRRAGASIIASMALRIRLTSTCWIWMRSTKHLIAARIELELDVDAMLARADQRQRIRFVDQRWQAFDPPLHLAVRHEVAQAAHDLAGTNRLLGGFLERLADHGELLGAGFRSSRSRAPSQ